MPSATIIVNVRNFQDIREAGVFCTLDPNLPLELAAGSSPRVTVAGYDILVRKNRTGQERKVELTFEIVASQAVPKPRPRYCAAGIAFDSKGANGLGSDFDLGLINDNEITFVNRFARKGKWKVYLMVEQRGVPDKFGIIDPGIENSESESVPSGNPHHRQAGKRRRKSSRPAARKR